MSRSLSTVAIQALADQETSQVALLLIEVTHAELSTPLRFVNNTTDLTSGGFLHLAFPFRIALPQERDDQLPSVTLSIDAVDRSLIQAIRTLTPSGLNVKLSAIFASEPDTIVAGPFPFTAKAVSYDEQTVDIELGFEDLLSEAYPAGVMGPGAYPGLF